MSRSASGSERRDEAVLAELEAILRDRLLSAPEGSYSARLMSDAELVQRKLVEEAFELCLELGRHGGEAFAPERVASEGADLVFHLLAGLVMVGVPLRDVVDELARRRAAAS